jgi:hypothetical protein
MQYLTVTQTIHPDNAQRVCNFSHCCRSELHFDKWHCAFPFHTLTAAICLKVVTPHFITSNNVTQKSVTLLMLPVKKAVSGHKLWWNPPYTHLEVSLCHLFDSHSFDCQEIFSHFSKFNLFIMVCCSKTLSLN